MRLKKLIRIISIIVQIIIVLTVALLIIQNSFIISFELGDFIFSFSSSYFLISFLIFFIIIFLIQNIYFKSKSILHSFKINKKNKRKEIGYKAFVDGMISLANKDYKGAILESKKIPKYLDDSPALSLLLKSEIFKIEKKYDQLLSIYEEMLKSKNTENLGLRGMMEGYLRSEDYHHAFIYGFKLFNNNPFIEKIYDTLVNIISKTNNWNQLIEITDRAYQKKIISKNSFQENKSIAFYEIAKIKKYSDTKESIKLIDGALNLRKNFPPYVELYIELLIEQKNFKTAKKIYQKRLETKTILWI